MWLDRSARAAVPVVLCLWLFWHLHYTWSLDEQYRYGWVVPFLAALLFQLRWQSRPPASPCSASPAWSTTTAVLLALLLPIRIVEEANPDWRLLSWMFALVGVGYSLVVIRRLGGKTWVRHFAFPICFTLVAVPWPVQFEHFTVQSLTRAVAAAAVEIAGWLGLGTYQLGNVIQLRNGFVGVDEACSGVRTLQAAIMVSLFLGELMQLPTRRRLSLLVVSCGWVFVCNVARASILVSIAGTRGFDALHRAHDTVGTAVMIVGLVGILAAARLLRGPYAPLEREQRRELRNDLGPPVRMRNVAAGVAWIAFVFFATELWYRAHERHLVARPPWSVEWPKENGTLMPLPIADSTRAILRFNTADAAAWRDARGQQWWGFFARWKAGRTALQLVRSHTPDICLPAVGRTFERELTPMRLDSASVSLPFRVYQFEQQGKPLFVFVGIQEDKFAPGAESGAPIEWSARGRILAAWLGRRNLGQRLLELAVIDALDFPHARSAAADVVRAIVR
jgi:exosortase